MTVCVFLLFFLKTVLRSIKRSVGSWLFITSLVIVGKVEFATAQGVNVDSLNAQAARLLERSPDQALRLSLQSVQVALKTNYLSGHTQALNLAGQSYYQLNNYKKSLQYFSQALDKATQRRQDPEAGNAYQFLGQAYFDFGDYDRSLDLFFHSLRIREKIRDKEGTAQSLMLLGSVYDAWGKLDKAEEYYKKSLKLGESLKNTTGLAVLYNHLGQLHDKRQEYSKALDYLTQSLTIHQKQKHTRGLGQALHSIGEVYFHQKKYDKALNYYFRALKREQKLNLLAPVARSYNSIAACHASTGKYQQAIFYYEKAIVQGRKAHTREPLMKAYLGIAESYGELKNYKDAYANHQMYSTIRDSIFNNRTYAKIAEVEAKYQLENQQQEVEILRKERRINAITLRENRNLTYLMGILIGVLLILAIVLISRYRIKQRASRVVGARNQTIRTQNAALQEANQKLTASEADLRNLIATKDKFFTLVSHDLRGPLNSLTGLFEVLIKHIDHFEKTELKKFVNDMNQTVKNVLNLVENLLHWSRTQRGGIRYEPQALSLQEVITNILPMVRSMAIHKNIDLHIASLPDSIIYADKNMIQFVLRNLIENAIKFTQEGGQIRVEADLQNNYVQIAVCDTGIGISPNDLPKLFRIDTYHTTNGTANESGTGLGLILCHEFVLKNGGQIGVESTLGSGTTFRFTIPAHVFANEIKGF